jgi:DNA-binding NtrC family response regulator
MSKLSRDVDESREAIDRRDPIRVLLVDEERPLADSCVMLLVNEGYQVRTCHRALEARALVQRETFDVVLLDAEMSQMAARSIMMECLDTSPDTRVIVMSGSSSVERSIETLNAGAWSYLAKPFSADHLRILMGRARHEILTGRDGGHRQGISGSPGGASADFTLLGRSPAFMRLIQLSRKVAATSASVLLTGESGSGKEMIAQFIHHNSRRRSKQMVAINCAALPETLLESEMFGHVKGAFTGATRDKPGLLEIADGGTLFLDELTEMPLQLQAKLLRVVQDGKVRRIGAESTHATVNVRFIAATNRDPLDALQDGTLRRDLYYRLGVVPIHLPPLRDRAEDIPQLAQYFLEKYWATYREPGTPRPTLTQSAIESLGRRPWRGNVRELQNVIEHAVVILEPGAAVDAADLPHMEDTSSGNGSSSNDSDLDASELAELTYHEAREQVLARFEYAYVSSIVRRADSNLSKAAKLAGVDRTTLYRLLEKHGLDRQRLAEPPPNSR